MYYRTRARPTYQMVREIQRLRSAEGTRIRSAVLRLSAAPRFALVIDAAKQWTVSVYSNSTPRQVA